MTVFLVETLVVKPEKQAEITAHLKNANEFTEKHPELFKEVKSLKIFAQMLGGTMGGYAEMLEFESLAEFEKWINRLMQDKEYMSTIHSEGMASILPGTQSLSMWSPVI